MNHPSLMTLFAHTAGIALVRPALQVEQVDMVSRLRRIWFDQRPGVGLIVGNGSVDGITLTMHGIATATPLAGVVDLVPIVTSDVAARAERLTTIAKLRLASILRGEAKDKRLNIVVAMIDERETLEEIARRVMEELNLSAGTCMAMHAGLERPGDGIVVSGLGHITDRPIIPRQPTITVPRIFRAEA